MSKNKASSYLKKISIAIVLALSSATLVQPANASLGTTGATFTFHGTGADSGTLLVVQKVAPLTAVALPGPGDLTKAEHRFIGWNDEEDLSGDIHPEGNKYTVYKAENHFYAQWELIIKSTISFDLNGGNGTLPTSHTAEVTTSMTLPSVGDITRTDYTFHGWNTQADGKGKTYNAESTYVIPATSTVLYAKWIAVPKSTITFNLNEGQGTVPTSQTVIPKTQITLPNVGDIKRVGYTFEGWNTQADGKGNDYLAGTADYVVPATSTVLYAKWIAVPKSTISFNANGGSGTTPDTYEGYVGSKIILPSKVSITKPNYAFTGWNTQADGKGKTYNVGSSFTFATTSVALYAQWEKIVTITFDANNANGIVPSPISKFATSLTVVPAQGNLHKTGATFIGWNTKADGKGQDYRPQSLLLFPTESMTLYAKWEIANATITFESNGATSGVKPSAITKPVGTFVTFTGPSSLSKTGYTFNGWNTKPDGSGIPYVSKHVVKMPASNMALFAIWTPAKVFPTTFVIQKPTATPTPTTATITPKIFRITPAYSSSSTVLDTSAILALKRAISDAKLAGRNLDVTVIGYHSAYTNSIAKTRADKAVESLKTLGIKGNFTSGISFDANQSNKVQITIKY